MTYWGEVAQITDILTLIASGGAPSVTYTISRDWQAQTVYLGSGSLALRWQFQYFYGYGGLHAAWVDQISFTPGGTAPFVTYISTNQTLLAGTNASFSVYALGTPPFAYQWQFNGTVIAGATNSALALTDVQVPNTGDYTVIVTNAFGIAQSNTTLTVIPAAPLIIAQPVSQAIMIRNNVTFHVVAQGSEPLTYQWQFNGTKVAVINSGSIHGRDRI